MFKKKIAGSLLAVLAVVALAFPVMAYSSGEYYWPWQLMSRNNVGTNSAAVSLEANANNNIIIDRVVCYSTSTSAEITVSTMTRDATSFVATETIVCTFDVCTTTTTGEGGISTLGGNHPEIPLWVADKGLGVWVRLINGGAKSQLVVNGRRGTMPLENPSKAKGY